MTLYSLSPRNSSHPIKDDAPSRIISSATIAFPILSRHWPHFDEECAASVIKNTLRSQREQEFADREDGE